MVTFYIVYVSILLHYSIYSIYNSINAVSSVTGHILQNAADLVGNSSVNEVGIWFHVRETKTNTFYRRNVNVWCYL